MPHVIVMKDHPHHLTEYEGKGTNISILDSLVNWGKFGNAI